MNETTNELLPIPLKQVLIMCSSKGSSLARDIGRTIDDYAATEISTTPWWGSLSQERWILHRVIETVRRYPYVILLLTNEDLSATPDEDQNEIQTRDNVLMELGIALATHSESRVFIAHPTDSSLDLPSNVSGLLSHPYSFSSPSDQNYSASLNIFCHTLADAIKMTPSVMSWDYYFDQITDLANKIQLSPHYGDGFAPHIVVGLNHGGLIISGYLHYLYNHSRWHYINLWFRNVSSYMSYDDRNKYVVPQLKDVLTQIDNIDHEKPRIIIVDDSDKTGESMSRAYDFLTEIAPTAEIKTAAIAYLGPSDKVPDYCNVFEYQQFKYGYL